MAGAAYLADPARVTFSFSTPACSRISRPPGVRNGGAGGCCRGVRQRDDQAFGSRHFPAQRSGVHVAGSFADRGHLAPGAACSDRTFRSRLWTSYAALIEPIATPWPRFRQDGSRSCTTRRCASKIAP
jgi:hypothetical protein